MIPINRAVCPAVAMVDLLELTRRIDESSLPSGEPAIRDEAEPGDPTRPGDQFSDF
jgi:hypothetical protein